MKIDKKILSKDEEYFVIKVFTKYSLIYPDVELDDREDFISVTRPDFNSLSYFKVVNNEVVIHFMTGNDISFAESIDDNFHFTERFEKLFDRSIEHIKQHDWEYRSYEYKKREKDSIDKTDE